MTETLSPLFHMRLEREKKDITPQTQLEHMIAVFDSENSKAARLLLNALQIKHHKNPLGLLILQIAHRSAHPVAVTDLSNSLYAELSSQPGRQDLSLDATAQDCRTQLNATTTSQDLEIYVNQTRGASSSGIFALSQPGFLYIAPQHNIESFPLAWDGHIVHTLDPNLRYVLPQPVKFTPNAIQHPFFPQGEIHFKNKQGELNITEFVQPHTSPRTEISEDAIFIDTQVPIDQSSSASISPYLQANSNRDSHLLVRLIQPYTPSISSSDRERIDVHVDGHMQSLFISLTQEYLPDSKAKSTTLYGIDLNQTIVRKTETFGDDWFISDSVVQPDQAFYEMTSPSLKIRYSASPQGTHITINDRPLTIPINYQSLPSQFHQFPQIEQFPTTWKLSDQFSQETLEILGNPPSIRFQKRYTQDIPSQLPDTYFVSPDPTVTLTLEESEYLAQVINSNLTSPTSYPGHTTQLQSSSNIQIEEVRPMPTSQTRTSISASRSPR